MTTPLVYTLYYIQYIYTFFYNINALLYNILISNAIKMYETHTHSFWYSSLQYNYDSFATQTLVAAFALTVMLPALS
jgi:hypothetical protein